MGWIQGLGERAFVGTESRLRLVFDLLKEIVDGSQEDPAEHLKELQRQKAALEERIRRVKRGELDLLDDTALRERFEHMVGTARELLADFREVEQNFRALDRSTRERIAAWDGSRSGLLSAIFEERDSINESDQGRSFRAFWDFLMSAGRQTELESLLRRSLEVPAIAAIRPDRSIRRVHHDWLEAGEHAQRSVALLSRELRRFLDDRAWLENRRIIELIGRIEANALALRADGPPDGLTMTMDLPAASVNLPLERPLYSPPERYALADSPAVAEELAIDSSALYDLVLVDPLLLRQRVRACLRDRDQIELAAVLAAYPLEHGLAELLGYLQLASSDRAALIDESATVVVDWAARDGVRRQARIPQVIFSREVQHESR